MPMNIATTTLSFEASDPLFEHVVGLRDDAGITLDGSEEGCALYGPYARLAAGTWRAEIHFSESPAPVGRAVMDIVVRSGNDQRGRREFDGTELDAADPIAVLDFALDQASDDLELRLFVFRGFQGRVLGIRLAPLALARQREAARPPRRTSYGEWRRIRIGDRVCRIMGDPDDPDFAMPMRFLQRLTQVLRVVRAVLPADGVMIDAGAKIGLAARAIAPSVPRGRVHAFESAPGSLRYLGANSMSEPLLNIDVVPLELGAPQTPGVTTLDLWAAGAKLTRLDLLKIDAAGAALDVLSGADGVVARFRPVVILTTNSDHPATLTGRHPPGTLEDLHDRFPFVFRLDGSSGASCRIMRGAHPDYFGHDLACCFDDSRLARLGTPT